MLARHVVLACACVAYLRPCVLAVCVQVPPDGLIGEQAWGTVRKPGNFVWIHVADSVGAGPR